MFTAWKIAKTAASTITAVAVFAAAAGCSKAPDEVPPGQAPPPPTYAEPSTAPHVLPTAATVDVDREAASSVLLAVCQIVFTRDASTEPSYSTSYERARGLITPRLNADLGKKTGAIRPYPQWVRWQEQGAWISGDCTETSDEHPADTGKSVSRVLSVNETVDIGETREVDERSAVVYATATRDEDGWKVDAFQVSPQ